MNEISLTEKEKLTLEEKIESSITHRKKQTLNFCLFIIGGILLSLAIIYWKNGNITLRMFFAHIIIGIFMLIPMSIAYLYSQRRINRLKKGLKT